ncbi:MAG: beta-propeller domain-containing protein [Thermoanaerobaculia bacterium]|nr:beta-propeller domain-containing protein [Thermoanaerobaculia bacterium]
MLSLCLSLPVATPSGAQSYGNRCPTGVLDGERAYFGSMLEPNTCDSSGQLCGEVLFFSEQRRETAICSSGLWQMRDEASSGQESCPQFVFADGQIWRHGSFVANTCDSASTQSVQTCDRVYFYRLPEGGAGYSAAACLDGAWRATDQPQPGDDDPFRLRRVHSDSELAAYLRQGLTATYGSGSSFLFGPGGGGGVTSPPSPGGTLTLSQTNVQEEGVDEEDRVKSDGDHLFVLSNFQTLREPPPDPVGRNVVRVLDIDAGQPSATSVVDFEVVIDDDQSAEGLYLRADASQLIVTASSIDAGWPFWYSPFAWLDAESTVVSVDVSDPADPEQNATLELEGEIISSRRIGDFVYLATRFQPRVQGLDPYDPNSPDSAQAIEAAQLDELTPHYRSTANPQWRPLVSPSNCYLPTEDAPVVAADIISLVAVDLDTLEVASSKCFVGATETLYVSPEAMYVASTRYEYALIEGPDGAPWTNWGQLEIETDVHKFSLTSGLISYRASGVVDGHLGWNILRKPFRLSESGDDLRVITYTAEITDDQSPVAITVLRDTGDDELQVLSRLPNALRPEPIGKPGERLYATRFVGDRAYLVTFLLTDPLYVVDLSHPEDPFVAGELEITGYSDYLHPIEGDYVLGIGKDAIPDPDGDFRGAWYQGLKVSLYDVSDPSEPFETDAVILGKRGSEAAVLQDHRALTFLQPADGNPRVAIGTRIHERLQPGTVVQPWTSFGWSYSGLQLFEIDTSVGRIIRRGEMRVEEYEPTPDGSGNWPQVFAGDRSVLAGDAVFFVHGDDIFTSFWSTPGVFEGPK